MSNKRAQVTIFIIVGLVLVLSTMIYLGFAGKLAYFDPNSIIAPDKTAVKNYVESCLRETLLDGVTLVAFQGGYAKIEEGPWKLNNRGDYEEFLGKNGFKIPYWDNNGKSFAPTRQDVEKSLEMYVDAKLDECLDNLTALRKTYDLTIEAPPKSNVILGPGKATIELIFPIMIKTVKKAGNTPVDEFYATVNTNMYEALELAHLIKQDNDLNQRLWNQTMEVIAGSELPYKGVEFDCKDKVWTMSQLENEFNTLINANMRFVTYKNTFNEKIMGEYPFPDYYANRYFFNIGAERRHQKFKVVLTPIKTKKFSVFPNKDELVTSIDINLPIFADLIDPCVNLYNHFYTSDYAVKFSISDDEELKFNFILPVNILYNKPKLLPEAFDDYQGFEDDRKLYELNYTMGSSEYCVDAPYEASVYVEDYITTKGIVNATVYYECVVFRCKLGQTDYVRDDFGVQISTSTMLKAKFPECINGNLVVESPNHQRTNIFVTPSEIDGSVKMRLKPTIEIPIELELKRFTGDVGISDDFNYDNISVFIGVVNHDNKESDHISYMPKLNQSKNLKIRIPLNDSQENNISIEITAINLMSNVTLGGYTYNGEFNGRTLIRANSITLPILTSETDPITEEDMIHVFKDIVIPYSKYYDPKIR